MLEIFRTNQFFATLLLIPYTFLIRIGSLIHSSPYEIKEYDTILVKYLYSHIFNSSIWQSIIASFIIFLIANFINRLIIQNRMSKQLTLLPGLCFIILTAGMPNGLLLSPALMAAFFTMICILNLYKAYKNKDSAVHIFNAGFYIAIAGIFYPACFFLLFFGFISLLNLRTYKFHEIIIYICGFFIPIFLLGTYYYANNNLNLIYQYFQFDKGILAIFSSVDFKALFSLFISSLSILYTLYKYNKFTMKNTIQVQKKIDILYWFLLFTLLIMFFINGIQYEHFIYLTIPFAYFIGISFEQIKNKLLAEIIHIGIVILVIFFQFQSVF